MSVLSLAKRGIPNKDVPQIGSDDDDHDDIITNLDIFDLKWYGKYSQMSEYIHLPSRIFAILNATGNGPIMAIIAKSARLNSLHIYHQYSQLSTRYRQMEIGCVYHKSECIDRQYIVFVVGSSVREGPIA